VRLRHSNNDPSNLAKAPQGAAPAASPTGLSPDESGTEVFLAPEALAITEARLCHLASLGLDLAGKKALEVGGGIGLRTPFFESLGCAVTFTDALPENAREAFRRYSARPAATLDLDYGPDLARLGQFDIVYCYGTLHHLSRPQQALRALAQICREIIVLETCVTPGDDEATGSAGAPAGVVPLPEPAEPSHQAASGQGCRPTRRWVMRQLQEHFGHAYQTLTQPSHPDFERNWLRPAPRILYRAVFIGSKHPLQLPTLSETLPDLQNAVPDETRGVWLDVGAHLGETTFERARAHAGLTVYAFEPDVRLAAQRSGQAPNYIVLPVAVAEQNGFARFYVNTNTAASSLLPFDQDRLRQWIGGEDLGLQAETVVPTVRLDHFLNALEIPRVDYLKIDTQGADFSVICSAGERLPDIRKIKLEVTVTPTQLYQGAAPKEEVIRYLTSRGFALIAEQPQTHGQEENLIFFRLGPAPGDAHPLNLARLGLGGLDLEQLVRPLSEERLLALARSVAELRPLGPYPGWSFSCAELSSSLDVLLRKAIWKICEERRLQTPLVFPWYDGLKLNLYLGNDMSRPTFIGGCIEPNEFAFMGSFLKPGMVMLDVGANDGFFTVFAARRVGESGRVYAFEPSAREFARLQANLALNRLENVQPVAKAVAEANGTGELRICEYGHEGQNTLGGFAHAVKQAGTQLVEICSLDAYFQREGLPRLDFMKIDVEGAEYKVLAGARRLLSEHKPVILMELLDGALRHQGSSAEAVIDLLRGMGFMVYDFAPATGKLVKSDSTQHSENIVASPQPLPL